MDKTQTLQTEETLLLVLDNIRLQFESFFHGMTAINGDC